MAEVVAEVRAAIADDLLITVYGDFDVDGVAATTILVTALRQLGARCDWFIPDRISEGYGLNSEAVAGLAARGTGLVITVDCGVTSVDEVSQAGRLGMGIIVTDHHRPGPVAPDCLILHPEISGYPFKDLCGAAVAAKLATALRSEVGLDRALDEADLDLVALATVADVMPLTGENRRLVREGLKVARRAQRPGMRSLIADSGVEPSQLSSADFGYRLGPRINAAGRIYRADAGVELFLADSAERADEIASELGRANNERRRIEREVQKAADAARRDLGDLEPSVLVLAGADWHPGVVGIVASSLVRAHGVPAVVISIDGDRAKGSARGVPGLDLYEAIASTAHLLLGFGGHAAAAGIQIEPSRIDDFRIALSAAVEAQLGPDPQPLSEGIDAIAGGEELALELAEEIETLEPCGKGNRTLSLLIPAARITDLREMGEGKHCRFSVVSGRARAAGVSFGRAGFGIDEDTPVDVLAELGINHWNGSSTPQLRVKEVYRTVDTASEQLGEELADCDEGEWWERLEAALGTPLEDQEATQPEGVSEREASIAELEGPAEIVAADLFSSGEPVLVLTADARRRWATFGGAEGISRLRRDGKDSVRGLWAGSGRQAVSAFADTLSSGVGVTDHATLAAHPDLAGACPITVVFDPPASEAERNQTLASDLTIRLLDPACVSFSEMASADRNDLTVRLRILYRSLLERGGASGEVLKEILAGIPDDQESAFGLAPEDSAALIQILVEAGLARTEGKLAARSVSIVSSEKVDLTGLATFSKRMRIHKEEIAYLRQSNR